ncbi:hypothetical protein F4781DRAFT_309900 [Annulohypoxylon bovei var. microspora]|nr:hypothetical protein F4781DRAFT_309900 [Annulohypoxylon bovei var. microspora]
MRNSNILLTAMLAAASVAAQTLPPSPTASVGCHAHEDHWHCDGVASSTVSVIVSSTENPESSQTLALSSTGSLVSSSSISEEHNEGTGSLAPSPTESVGCEPHGDHWHCDGAVIASSTSSVQPTETAGVGKLAMVNAVIIGGLLVTAAMGL